MAKKSANVETILWENHDDVVKQIRDMTTGRGAEVCVDAVGFEPDRSLADCAKAVLNLEKGSPKITETCMSAVRRGGIVSVVGAYATPFDNFPVRQFSIRASLSAAARPRPRSTSISSSNTSSTARCSSTTSSPSTCRWPTLPTATTSSATRRRTA
ncbi:hypothetical protein [Hymenobacter nivis]|uniref:hypothetical protein n=1 Tax=Hymenobacter nivis TaxID=1850093 RepID=UPI0026BEA8D9